MFSNEEIDLLLTLGRLRGPEGRYTRVDKITQGRMTNLGSQRFALEEDEAERIFAHRYEARGAGDEPSSWVPDAWEDSLWDADVAEAFDFKDYAKEGN